MRPGEGVCAAMNPQFTDPESLHRHFAGGEELLPLWIAEPYVDLAPEVTVALESRAQQGWYGYETRPPEVIGAFWSWMNTRHNWGHVGLQTLVSPSVGTSIGVLIEQLTKPGDGVILQPPVFTDFKPLVLAAERSVAPSALVIDDGRYRMDLHDLAVKAANPDNTALILCNPHNPVGRVWTRDELSTVAEICAAHSVVVIADEIHADLNLSPHAFTPFAVAAADTGVRWAALHGPIKTFGLAGVCDTLMITADEQVATLFETRRSQLHLTRNNVFGLAAFEAAYRADEAWLDGLLELVAANRSVLQSGLPDGVELSPMEGTYLAWLDFRALGMDVPQLSQWLAEDARLALSPGHWFGRQGAGFARMTIAAPTSQIEDAIERITHAVGK